jgi:16S rRNA (cytosine967-C5)-methyltransferase
MQAPLSPREEAYRVLMATRREPATLNNELAKLREKEFRGRHDLNLAILLISGTTKLQKRLDLILARFLRKKLSSHSDSLLTVLRLGCFQLLPDTGIPHYAAVNETVNLAKKYTPGAEALVNAVLKNVSKQIETLTFAELRDDPLNFLTQYYSYPIWFVRELLSYWPEPVVEKLLKYGNEPQPLVVRLMERDAGIKDFVATLQRRNVRFKQGKFLKYFINVMSDAHPTEIPGFSNGAFVIQNEASGLMVELLSVKESDEVLDLCAAPGGKTTDLASRVGQQGSITAVDISQDRLQMLRENLERLGIGNVFVVQADGTRFASGTYDKIMVDAPCSGTGVFRKFPEARWITAPEDVGRLAQLQVQLLSNAAKLLKPDGLIVYCTCSVLKAENEFVVERFLNEHPDFDVATPSHFPYSNLVGEDRLVRTYPGLKYLDNMFAACLSRKTAPESKTG